MSKRPPTAAEKRHHDRVRALPCLVSGRWATLHHVTGYADRMGRLTRSERLVVPLAREYHQKVWDPKASDPISVEALSHRGFYAKHGVDLYAEARRLEAESVALGILPELREAA